ncbi:hypothetical protein AABB24_038475 [Solanum stoloniferum]|uniref:MATH domain-containing protein n=1 Tax=Solanum stoloniferum TaxID=62892 RepID=A0ABD2QXP0_9SOLN
MIIYPDGNRNEKGSEHIPVYLAITGTGSLPAGWEVNVTVTFFLFNQLCNNYFTVRGKMHRFHFVKSEWGLPKFLPHKIFKEAGYLVYDKCSFGAEILVGQGSGFVPVGRKKNELNIIQRQAVGECLSMVKSNKLI